MAISSEYHSYNYIKRELESLGWNIHNPTRRADGQVYTQNECLQNETIKSIFRGNERPENIILVKDRRFWIIEAKPLHNNLEKAIEEAEYYAERLNKDEILAPIISAVVGNDEDTYLVQNFYFKNNKWLPIFANNKELTGLLSPDIARYLIDNNTNNINDFNLPDEVYYNKAKKINEILHIGSINKNYRARVMAAILLALSEGTPLNLDSSASLLIKEINARVEEVLSKNNKKDFVRNIQINEPPTPDNHIKFRKALVDTIQELKGINIRSAMNSGTDILGRFYEIFLKYGNGAKEIGIVLTPRHITKFAAEVLSICDDDIVFDPACGTGGFLVAAFDHVRKQCTPRQLDTFKENNIYGIEQEPDVMALALVNMIFRGDGKNNMMEGNCFFKSIEKKATVVLMNPPFALRKDDEKENRFVDRALEQMKDGGLMFVILPSTIMFKGQVLKAWRDKLLRNNTLKAVIKLPEDLFYPIGVHTSAVIIQKGVPHAKDGDVFWGYLDDGFAKKKGAMKKIQSGNIDIMLSAIKDFIAGSTKIHKSIARQYQLSPIQFDKDLECAPEYYLKENSHTEEEIAGAMDEVFMSLFNFLINSPYRDKTQKNIGFKIKKPKENDFDILFGIINAQSSNIEDYSFGEIPFVTSTELNNGVEKYIDPDENSLIIKEPCITISSFGYATVQLIPFVGRSHGAIIILKPKTEMGLTELLYYAAQLNLQRWRFSYGRWVTKKRLLKLEIQHIAKFSLPLEEHYLGMVKEKFVDTNRLIFI